MGHIIRKVQELPQHVLDNIVYISFWAHGSGLGIHNDTISEVNDIEISTFTYVNVNDIIKALFCLLPRLHVMILTSCINGINIMVSEETKNQWLQKHNKSQKQIYKLPRNEDQPQFYKRDIQENDEPVLLFGYYNKCDFLAALYDPMVIAVKLCVHKMEIRDAIEDMFNNIKTLGLTKGCAVKLMTRALIKNWQH